LYVVQMLLYGVQEGKTVFHLIQPGADDAR
jgi:hypothetical protein